LYLLLNYHNAQESSQGVLVQFTFAVFATNFATFAVPFCFNAEKRKVRRKGAQSINSVLSKLHQYLTGVADFALRAVQGIIQSLRLAPDS
jgi:hypothetical protein